MVECFVGKVSRSLPRLSIGGPIKWGVEIKIDCIEGQENVKQMEDYL
jgi:hypothetical protein